MNVIAQKYNVDHKVIERCIQKVSKKYDRNPQEIIDIVVKSNDNAIAKTKDINTDNSDNTKTKNNDSTIISVIDLYVDGSFSDRSPYAGWAWAIVINNQLYKSDSGKTDKPAQSRQIDGELYATMKGLAYIRRTIERSETTVGSERRDMSEATVASERRDMSEANVGNVATERSETTVGKIVIRYDYAGIENHLVSPSNPKYWRPKKPISLLYVKTMKELGLQNVSFEYVKAHTGNVDAHSKWNDFVDGLAKKAIGIK